MKLKYIPAVLLLLLCAIPLPAQSTAEEMETLLATEAVTYEQAVRFLLEASDAFATYDSQEAFRYAQEQKWLPKKVSADDKARLNAVSFLAMRSFEMKGGVMYSITKKSTALGSHYSYRELTAKKIIQGRTSPRMNVSGRLLLFITERMITVNDTDY